MPPTLAERLALAAIAEGYRLVEEAVAGAEEIERALTAGAGWAAGPFTLAGRRGLRGVVTALAAIARDPAVDAADPRPVRDPQAAVDDGDGLTGASGAACLRDDEVDRAALDLDLPGRQVGREARSRRRSCCSGSSTSRPRW